MLKIHTPTPAPPLQGSSNPAIESFDLHQRAVKGLHDALDVLLGTNPMSLAVSDLEHALGRGRRGLTALKRLKSMTGSGSAANTVGNVNAFPVTCTQPMVGLKKRRSRRHFDQDYKREVAQLIRERHMTIAQASRELNLTYSALRRWVLEFDAEQAAASVNAGKFQSADDERICALEKQLRQLKSDNELLKKASALFAREIY